MKFPGRPKAVPGENGFGETLTCAGVDWVNARDSVGWEVVVEMSVGM